MQSRDLTATDLRFLSGLCYIACSFGRASASAVLETGRDGRGRFQKGTLPVSTLYRPKIVSYTLPGGKSRTPDGQRVTKETPGAVRRVSRSSTWWGRYTDGAGQRHQVKLSTNKDIARRMLAKLAGDAQLAGVGIHVVDPFAEHYERPLEEHLDDFARMLRADRKSVV